MSIVCKHCKKKVSVPHRCKVTNKTYSKSDEGDFALSMVIGYATNDGLIGGMVGGSLVGGMFGEAMNTTDCGSSFSSDSGPSGSDSGGCSGGD